MKSQEHLEQCTVVAWARLQERKYPDLWFLYAIPNGGLRHPAVAKKLKEEGVKAGGSDLHLPISRHGYHSLYIEMKSAGGRISKAQTDWINKAREQGNAAFVCYSANEAIEKLKWYLGGHRGSCDR